MAASVLDLTLRARARTPLRFPTILPLRSRFPALFAQSIYVCLSIALDSIFPHLRVEDDDDALSPGWQDVLEALLAPLFALGMPRGLSIPLNLHATFGFPFVSEDA